MSRDDRDSVTGKQVVFPFFLVGIYLSDMMRCLLRNFIYIIIQKQRMYMSRSFVQRIWKRFIASLPLQYIFFSLFGLFAFYQIFNFWFFHGWETSWLGPDPDKSSFTELMRSHGFISYLNYMLFGWNPRGWFVTALLLHLFATFAAVYFVGTILKNRVIGFLTGLVFVATTAHHDVVTWGSFESLYAAQTLGFYLTLIFFYAYRKTGKMLLYGASLLTFFLSAILRESGLILIPILFVFDSLLLNSKLFADGFRGRFDKKKIRSFLAAQLLFWLVGGVYILLRISYGGSPNDFIDERVQFRILLFNEYRFLEYFGYGILAFGQYIPPYFIPYPLLNFLKGKVYAQLPLEFIHYYFFVVMGWAFYIGIVAAWILQRKSKFFLFLSFFLTMFTIITAFYSLAWTVKLSFLPIPYSWSENRWRYFAFTALAPFLIISLFNFSNFLRLRFRTKHLNTGIITGVIFFYVSVNFVFLHYIQQNMYIQNHHPSKQFYSTFVKVFPNLTEDMRFYQYRGSPGLNDFFAELSVIKQEFYPNVKKLPSDWVRVDMYYPLLQLSEGRIQTDKFRFVDFSVNEGVRDRSEEVYRYHAAQKEERYDALEFQREGSWYTVELAVSAPVELRKYYTLRYTAAPAYKKSGSSVISDDHLSAIAAYSRDIAALKNARVKVCKTMGPEKEPFYDFRGSNIVDGNLSKRSYWWADCRPAWVEVDLGEEREIHGFAWSSINAKDAAPRNYYYEVSNDGKKWETVSEVRANQSSSRIDLLNGPIKAQYIRFTIVETEYRAMAIVNEFVPIFSEFSPVASSYQSLEEVYNDIYSYVDSVSTSQIEQLNSAEASVIWAKVVWQTKPENSIPEEERTYYIPLFADGSPHEYTFEIPESEYYSVQGQFLDRYITAMTFQFHYNTEVSLQDLTVTPMFPNR